jgi:hypothetical protein
MRFIMGLMLLLTPAFAAALGGQTLVARLALDTLSELQIVASSGDETHANYTLVSKVGVRPILGTVQKKLLADGWASHPNLSETPLGTSPSPGTPNLRATGRQVRSFVRANEFLEVRVAPVGRSQLVSLSLTLIIRNAAEQGATSP